ncbi:MAG: hypothetical protein ACAH17_01355 [Candidatus Paceibacterota bacterium]
MTRTLSWIEVVLFSLVLIGGTFFATRTYVDRTETATPTVVASSTDSHPVLVRHQVTPLPASDQTVEDIFPVVRCLKNASENEGVPERCRVDVKGIAVALPEIKELNLELVENYEWQGSSKEPNIFNNFVFVELSACEYRSCVRYVFSANLKDAEPKFEKVYTCDSNCVTVNGLRGSAPVFIEREVKDDVMTVYRTVFDSATSKKELLATVDLNGWTSGTVCLGAPCLNGSGWATIFTHQQDDVLLAFDKRRDSSNIFYESYPNTKHLILELE